MHAFEGDGLQPVHKPLKPSAALAAEGSHLSLKPNFSATFLSRARETYKKMGSASIVAVLAQLEKAHSLMHRESLLPQLLRLWPLGPPARENPDLIFQRHDFAERFAALPPRLRGVPGPGRQPSTDFTRPSVNISVTSSRMALARACSASLASIACKNCPRLELNRMSAAH
jgi:hypothetical protein